MNIGYFNYIGSGQYSSSAAAIQINLIAKHLELLGHRVKIFFRASGQKNLQTGKRRLASLFRDKFKLNRFLHEPRLLLSNIKFLFSDNVILHRERMDILIIRYSNFIIAPFILAKLKRIPVILYADGLEAYENRIFENQYLHIPYLPEFLERACAKTADAVIANTEQTKRYFLNRGVPGEKITVVENGVDPRVFSPCIDGSLIRRKLNIPSEVTLVGFVGGFHPWHGFEDFIRIFEMVLSKNTKLKFLLVGEGPLRRKLENALSTRRYAKTIIFAGRVAHSEIPKYIASMDICIMPNSNSYGSPMKIFEYMAMGKPVIAPSIGPIADIITDGLNGILISPGDYKAFSQAILNIATNKELAFSLGKNAIENIKKNHTWQKKAQKISNLCTFLVRSDYSTSF